MRTHAVTVCLLTALAVSACSAGGGGGVSVSDTSPSSASAAQGADPTARTVGDTVTLSDSDGEPLKITLTGVAYRDALAKDKTASVRGKYAVALAFTLKSASGGAIGEQTNNMIKWEGGGVQVEEWDYVNAPWQGCIDAYSIYADLPPGNEYKAITDVNPPSKGGTLIITDEWGGVARWNLPSVDTGIGTEPATKFTTRDCR